LSFLTNKEPPSSAAYLRQALLTRPNAPAVYLQVGIECWFRSESESARECWRHACRLEPQYQRRLLPVLSSQLPLPEVVSFLEPDFEGCIFLAHQELKRGQRQASKYLAYEALNMLEKDHRRLHSPSAWLTLIDLFREQGLGHEEEGSLRRAIT